jgi:aromatic-L-amino-acid decarboxylase
MPLEVGTTHRDCSSVRRLEKPGPIPAHGEAPPTPQEPAMIADTSSSNSGMPADAMSPLALDPAELRRLGYRAVDLMVEHLAGIANGPVFQPMTPDERRALLDPSLPASPTAPDAILEQIREQILSHPMGNGHPRFFGWINSPPVPFAALADLLAAALNPSCAGGDHAAIYLERCVVRWLMELLGFPTEGSMGLLVSGGSMASLTCLAAARSWVARRDGWDVRQHGVSAAPAPLSLYMTEEGHSSIRKAAELMGLGATSLRTLPVDGDFRMDVDALRQAITRDRAAGLRPFCVAASAGTVGTGAIDPLDALADLCAEEDLWLHVDGAYGAVGVLDPTVAARYAGLDRVHSLTLDPHKWLSVPVECGCALVRDGALLRETFSLVPPYLRTEEGKGFGGLPWYAEYGFQQTRGFRALKLWSTLLLAGRDGLAQHIIRCNALARRLGSLVAEADDLELLAPVELSVVCFRYAPPALGDNATGLDALNKAIMEEVQAGGEVFLTQTTLGGKFSLRACVVHYATTEDDLRAPLTVVRRVGARLT